MMMFMHMLMAVACFAAGYVFKVKRWRLLIEVYEKPQFSDLLKSLSLGQTINAVLPVRAGDIVRIILSGRKLKNGYALSLGTVLADLYVDTISVGIVFWLLSFTGKGDAGSQKVARFYLLLVLILVFLTLVCIYKRKYVKKIIASISGIFNEDIEFGMLYISYLTIASLKDIVRRINKNHFIFHTVAMCLGYALSYVFFAEVLHKMGFGYTVTDVFTILFSGAILYRVAPDSLVLWAAFLLLPLLVCFIASYAIRSETDPEKIRFTLPQASKAERLSFLKTYYAEEKREYIEEYLKINDDVTIIRDYSAGSDASTILVMREGELYFRKYAFGEAGVKLAEQIAWIEGHQKDVPLPCINEKRYDSNFVTYDMRNYTNAVGFFRYMHTMPAIKAWKILEECLTDLKCGLHVLNRGLGDQKTIEAYISSKVKQNLSFIAENDKYISNLEKNEHIYVNGKKLRTLKSYGAMFRKEHLLEVFRNDAYADIHGDLTIENIICLLDDAEIKEEDFIGKKQPKVYYLIDPNTGNVHNSPYLDYAKLLQSLHGGYEFLMMVPSVEIGRDRVDYMAARSEAYGIVYDKYKNYLKTNFSPEEVLSIYYHEIIHWLRLMPYKIRRNEKTAVIFYAGLLQVISDVWEMEHER